MPEVFTIWTQLDNKESAVWTASRENPKSQSITVHSDELSKSQNATTS